MGDYALDLAYKAHRKYLDADSADCGPIEDYIADAIREALTAKCAEAGILRVAARDARIAKLERLLLRCLPSIHHSEDDQGVCLDRCLVCAVDAALASKGVSRG